ncbi:Aste57867_10584 [Aphanomyces stellatus]|uniref:Aste57867_10584 protein n=1 Tax=Aphanomyces stellatus TaxID=120398 RepID=A0A485KRE8_9STRA|nr:hypothetical protein As57867_010544 [Aphanomyces stellatus]VFT87456.1 Aste57867_10584 [Aphanomyces stellatus]
MMSLTPHDRFSIDRDVTTILAASLPILHAGPPSSVMSSKAGGLHPPNTQTPNVKLLELVKQANNKAGDLKPKPNDAHSSGTLANHPPNETTSAESGISDASQAGGNSGRKYERRTKRFIWPDELHRLFVAAVFDVGLKNASPKALLNLMGTPACMSGLTTEHLKSHLQKYRLNYDRSRVEFLKFFDESVSESTKQHKRKNKAMQPGAVTSLFPICPKKRKSSDDMDEPSSDDDEDGADQKVAKVVDATINITRQLDVQSKTLQMQKQFQEEIQQQLYEQALLQRQLQERLAEVTVRKGESPLDAQLPPPITALTRTTSYNANPTTAAPAMGRPRGGASNNPLQDQITQLGQLDDHAKDRANMQWQYMLHNAGGGGGGPNFLSPSLGAGMDPSSGPTNSFSLEQQNASHIQMQLAMQQQMRLHQQMLLRKVEVSQSSAGVSSANANNSAAVAANNAAAAVAATSSRETPSSFTSQLEEDWTTRKDDGHATGHAAAAAASHDTDMSNVFAWDDINVDMNDDLFGFLK